MPPARKARRLVRRRDPAAPWTDRDRARFLRALAEGSAVPDAAAAIGRTVTSALAERSRDPGFAARWDCALDCAFEVLETRLLSLAIGGVAETPAPYDSGRPARRPDETRLARWILAHLRDNRAGAAGARPGRGQDSGRAAPQRSPDGGPARLAAPAAPSGRPDPAVEQARIDRLIDEVADRIAAAEARLPARRMH